VSAQSSEGFKVKVFGTTVHWTTIFPVF